MAKKLTQNNKIGVIGENIVTRFLQKEGFQVKDRNYSKKWGEIDIVAEKEGILHFVEVKAVSCEKISHETSLAHAAENVHLEKLKRLQRVIQTYLLEKQVDGEWEFDVLLVGVDLSSKRSKVEALWNVVL